MNQDLPRAPRPWQALAPIIPRAGRNKARGRQEEEKAQAWKRQHRDPSGSHSRPRAHRKRGLLLHLLLDARHRPHHRAAGGLQLKIPAPRIHPEHAADPRHSVTGVPTRESAGDTRGSTDRIGPAWMGAHGDPSSSGTPRVPSPGSHTPPGDRGLLRESQAAPGPGIPRVEEGELPESQNPPSTCQNPDFINGFHT